MSPTVQAMLIRFGMEFILKMIERRKAKKAAKAKKATKQL